MDPIDEYYTCNSQRSLASSWFAPAFFVASVVERITQEMPFGNHRFPNSQNRNGSVNIPKGIHHKLQHGRHTCHVVCKTRLSDRRHLRPDRAGSSVLSGSQKRTGLSARHHTPRILLRICRGRARVAGCVSCDFHGSHSIPSTHDSSGPGKIQLWNCGSGAVHPGSIEPHNDGGRDNRHDPGCVVYRIVRRNAPKNRDMMSVDGFPLRKQSTLASYFRCQQIFEKTTPVFGFWQVGLQFGNEGMCQTI